MDDCADLTHGLVNGGKGQVKSVDHLVDAHLFFADLLLGRIELHTRRKELLDRKIM